MSHNRTLLVNDAIYSSYLRLRYYLNKNWRLFLIWAARAVEIICLVAST